uniref:Uncharacterized protein n=1 Tax=Arundo donax TaxID=35708 RepID=A0A0A9BCX1_ARUDO
MFGREQKLCRAPVNSLDAARKSLPKQASQIGSPARVRILSLAKL